MMVDYRGKWHAQLAVAVCLLVSCGCLSRDQVNLLHPNPIRIHNVTGCIAAIDPACHGFHNTSWTPMDPLCDTCPLQSAGQPEMDQPMIESEPLPETLPTPSSRRHTHRQVTALEELVSADAKTSPVQFGVPLAQQEISQPKLPERSSKRIVEEAPAAAAVRRNPAPRAARHVVKPPALGQPLGLFPQLAAPPNGPDRPARGAPPSRPKRGAHTPARQDTPARQVHAPERIQGSRVSIDRRRRPLNN